MNSPFFLNEVLQSPVASLFKSPLWVLRFENVPVNTIAQIKAYEPGAAFRWDIQKGMAAATSDVFLNTAGCMFAQSVNIPGEQNLYTVQGLNYNGFIRAKLGQGRQDFSNLQITFYESNVSFVDNVLRPWTIMTGHLGMVQRPDKPYKTKLIVYRLGRNKKSNLENPGLNTLEVTQAYSFFGVCPMEVRDYELNYTAQSSPIRREVQFSFDWYDTTSGLDSTNTQPFAESTPIINVSTPSYRRDNPKGVRYTR
jgi:hypothetical protein